MGGAGRPLKVLVPAGRVRRHTPNQCIYGYKLELFQHGDFYLQHSLPGSRIWCQI
jgi:hypothetical protein